MNVCIFVCRKMFPTDEGESVICTGVLTVASTSGIISESFSVDAEF